jgi:hypothetical protein
VRRVVTAGAALAAFSLASGAAWAAKIPPGFAEEKHGLLRHQATGLALPKAIGPYARAMLSEGKATIVAIYIPRQVGPVEQHDIAVAIGSSGTAVTRDEQRAGIRAEVERIGTPEILAEESFAWPGHPAAQSFHGAYVVGRFRKEYWSAADGAARALAVITVGRQDSEQMALLSAAVAASVFGGAAPAPTPKP